MRSADARRLSHWLWYDRPVRWQLLASFVLINLAAGAAAGGVVVYNAHKATAVEVASSMEVAEQTVRRTADQLAQKGGSDGRESLPLPALESLALSLRHLRHVRISVADGGGHPVSVQPADPEGTRGGRSGAPGWFAALVRLDRISQEVPVTLEGRHIATVLVTSRPDDEIAEVWQDVSHLAGVVLVANVIVIGLFYLALGRVLGPLRSVAAGLQELELGRFGYRLPRPQVRELGDIVDRFNALAGALESARGENARLNRRLVTAQDDERREIATELHDELGACLFGLRANVLSVQRLAQSLPPGLAEPIRLRAATLVEVSERIQSTNRRVLRRLRPMALGHAALADVIADLVAEFERNAPDHTLTLDIGRLRRGYGDCIDLTVYRCVQEGLTNAMRHAVASTVAVRLDEVTASPARLDGSSGPVALRLLVSDDGGGLVPGALPGLGLTGMERRVRALGGVFAVTSRPGGGTRLDITIPVEEWEPGTAASADAGVGRQ
jgi:two-component system sensor histidine kinase UhpB